MAKKKDKNVSSENALNENIEAKKRASTKNADYKYVIQNQKIRRQARHKNIVKTVGIILLVVIAAIGIFYGAYTAVQINSFKVFVDSSGSKVLSLSSTSSFAYGSEQLEIGGPDVMDNTTLASKRSLVNTSPIQDRLEDILEAESFQCGKEDRFIAATFYLRNVTTEPQKYNEVLNLRKSTLGVEKAIRVMLIRKRSSTPDYEVVVYAKYNPYERGDYVFNEYGDYVPYQDGIDVYDRFGDIITYKPGDLVPERVVPLTKNTYSKLEMTTIIDENGKEKIQITQPSNEPWIADDFFSEEYVFYNKGFDLAPLETIKYGIIIWLEGWDEDCVDDKIQGTIRMDFAFEQKK